jgi:hypothetical protein
MECTIPEKEPTVDNYEPQEHHSGVLDRLARATEQVQAEQQADIYGYHADSGYPNMYTPASPEGDLDQYGPADSYMDWDIQPDATNNPEE